MRDHHGSFALPNPWLAAAAPGENGPSTSRGAPREIAANPLRVLIVEDEFFISLNTEMMLKTIGHEVVGIAVSADQAVSMADRERPDVVLMDIRLIGGRDGIDAAVEIRDRFDIGSIFVTANADPQTRLRADAAKPIAFLEKPLTEQRLRGGLASVDFN
jgi:CheY-like chemotaxis protein